MFKDQSDAFWHGVREALGAPLWVLFAGMIGFGAMGQGVGVSAGFTGFTSFAMFALPGQVVLLDMLSTGSSYVAITLAVTLTSSRFIMMIITLFPQLAGADRSAKLYAYSHLLAMTAWAVSMREFHRIEPEHRLSYFLGLGLPCWLIALPATLVGYYLASWVPAAVTLGLVFINPLFFLLTFTEVKPAANRLAIVLGGLLVPAFYLLDKDTSLLAAGLVGGTVAYYAERLWSRRCTAGAINK
jgi:predicted branched-subunit amino acid permease